jgi:hypothetical protein
MRSTLIRTAAVTSLVTALVVSGVAFYAMPKLAGADQPQPFQPYQNGMMTPNGVTLHPAAYAGQPIYGQPMMQPAYYTQQPVMYQTPAPRVVRTVAPVATSSEPLYRETRQKRSTGKSVLIVAGSSGAGAAIGGLTGGKKGAAIGAIAGGVAGLIYDRSTANPK